MRIAFLTLTVAVAFASSSSSVTTQSIPTAPTAVVEWWKSLGAAEKEKLSNPFEQTWFARLPSSGQAAYAKVVKDLNEFLDTAVDSHPADSYVGFEPLLLRTSFHSAGTFHKKSGTGGANGGTIFQKAELEDGGNACIEIATEMLQELLGSQHVPLADCVVVAGIVALERMEFPRMDLLQMTGGRKDIAEGVAHRDRLPEADDDPFKRFTEQMGFTVEELVALIGGSHNFGSAHGGCSGYEGQWTSNPLSWGGPGGDAPQFFTELMRTDWRWYQVCTFQSSMVHYTSIPDPFAAVEEEAAGGGAAEVGDVELACKQAQSEEPLLCEEQAMRGCEFADGAYQAGVLPCEGVVLRLKSDFWLKKNPLMLPHAEAYAADAGLFAEQFGNAYHKLTHNGLARCGMSGHGCGEHSTCEQTRDEADGSLLFEQCVALADSSDHSRSLSTAAIVIGVAGAVLLLGVGGLIYYSASRRQATAAPQPKPSPSQAQPQRMAVPALPHMHNTDLVHVTRVSAASA